MSEHYDPDIQAQKDYEALNAETARKLVRTAIKLKKAEARIEQLEGALDQIGQYVEHRYQSEVMRRARDSIQKIIEAALGGDNE